MNPTQLKKLQQYFTERRISLHSELLILRIVASSLIESLEEEGLTREADYTRALFDEETAVKELRELTLDGGDAPFFSEETLYDLIGKDNARTVLSAVNKVLKITTATGEELD